MRADASAPPSAGFGPAVDAAGLRRIHKEASITISADDPEAASGKIDEMVKGAGGFVGESDLSTDANGKTLHVTLKVPVQQFDTILSGIAGLGEIQAKHLEGDDITKQVSDADARDAELEQEEQDAEQRLAAKKVKMDWRTEEWMRDLKIQLAEARADLKNQRSLADLGDIDLTITSKQSVQTGFGAGFGSSGHDALQSLTTTLGMLMSALVWVMVYAPIWLPTVLLGRWAWVAYNRRVETAE